MGTGLDDEFWVQVPAIDLMKVLSGALSSEEVFDDEYPGSPTPLTWFKRALQENMDILEVETLNSGGPTARIEPQVRITFGNPKPPVVAHAKGQE